MLHLNCKVWCVPTCVFMYECSSNSSTLYLSHLHFLVFTALLHLSTGALYSCSNCHWSDCSSLDAMEAVIGHPRHSDQCHRYYQDFRHPGPRQPAQPRPKGNWKGGKRWCSTACYGCTETGQLLVKVSIDSSPSNMHLLSPSSSLTLSLHRMCLSASSHF